MDTRLQRLVLDDKATVSVRFTRLRTELGFDVPESNVAWASSGLAHRGRRSDGSWYFKHGSDVKKEQTNADFKTVTYFVRRKMRRRKISLINGIEVDDFIRPNADEVWLMQHGYFDVLEERAVQREEPWCDRETQCLPRRTSTNAALQLKAHGPQLEIRRKIGGLEADFGNFRPAWVQFGLQKPGRDTDIDRFA